MIGVPGPQAARPFNVQDRWYDPWPPLARSKDPLRKSCPRAMSWDRQALNNPEPQSAGGGVRFAVGQDKRAYIFLAALSRGAVRRSGSSIPRGSQSLRGSCIPVARAVALDDHRRPLAVSRYAGVHHIGRPGIGDVDHLVPGLGIPGPQGDRVAMLRVVHAAGEPSRRQEAGKRGEPAANA